MLLGDPHVVGPIGEALLRLDEAGALEHRGGDRDDARVLLHLLAERVREQVGVRLRGRLLHRLAGRDVEERQAVPARRLVRLGGLVALPLRGDRVQEDRAVEDRELPEGLDEALHVVAVHRADVAEAEPLEEDAGRDERLRRVDAVRIISIASGPFGTCARKSFTAWRQRLYVREANFFENHSDSAPTLGEIDISSAAAQGCIAAKRFIVVESVEREFEERFQAGGNRGDR